MVLPVRNTILPFDENSCSMRFYKNEIKSDIFSENLNQLNSHDHEIINNSENIPVTTKTNEHISQISSNGYYGYTAALANVEQTMHNNNNNNITASSLTLSNNIIPPVEMEQNYVITRNKRCTEDEYVHCTNEATKVQHGRFW
jgi:uncharacterized protein YwgA